VHWSLANNSMHYATAAKSTVVERKLADGYCIVYCIYTLVRKVCEYVLPHRGSLVSVIFWHRCSAKWSNGKQGQMQYIIFVDVFYGDDNDRFTERKYRWFTSVYYLAKNHDKSWHKISIISTKNLCNISKAFSIPINLFTTASCTMHTLSINTNCDHWPLCNDWLIESLCPVLCIVLINTIHQHQTISLVSACLRTMASLIEFLIY
jgi:hypothetical protein